MKGDIVVVPEGAHSELGPSSADRWINCPGSVLASRGVERDPTSYALEGTAAHTVSEWVRRRCVPAETYLGTTLRITHGDRHWDVKCNKAMVLSVQQFCDRVGQLPGYELVEARVNYEEYVPGGFGTSDSIKLNDYVTDVGDFKHGKGVKKHARMLEQLLLYSVGAYLGWRWAYEFDTFRLRIYQPRLVHFDEAEITLSKLLQWAGDVARPAAARALKPGAPFKAGPWCQFCKIRPTCGVYSEYRQQRVRVSRAGDLDLIGDLS